MALRLCQIQYGTTGQILFSISGRQEVNVKSKKSLLEKIGMSGIPNPGAIHDGGPPSWWTMHLEVEKKYYLRQLETDGVFPPVLDSLDNYKILSERMNVLTIYLPWWNWSHVKASAQPNQLYTRKMKPFLCFYIPSLCR